MKRNRSDSRHNSHSEDETANDGMGEDKGGGMEDLPQLVVTRANLSKMDGLLRSTLTFEGKEGSRSNKQIQVFMRRFRKRIMENCQDLCLLEDHFNEENVVLSGEWAVLCNRLRAVKGRLRVKRARVPHMAELLAEQQLQHLAEKRLEELVDSNACNVSSDNLDKKRAKLNMNVQFACTEMKKVKGPLEELALEITPRADNLRNTMLSVKNLLEANKRGTEAAMRHPPPRHSDLSQQATHPLRSSAAEAREKERELKSNDLRMKKSSGKDAILARLLNDLP